MTGRTVVLLSLMMPLISMAQPARELLRDVPSGYAIRLEEYNSAAIQLEAFNAYRYRIVRANINTLLQERDITITPFDDVDPIEVSFSTLRLGTAEGNHRQDEVIEWHGQIQNDSSGLSETAPDVNITVSSWDVDPDGNASLSWLNRFEHSPDWEIDENGQPVFRGDIGANVGPPPDTPAAIDRHRKMQELKKHQFRSLSATIESGDTTYRVVPLKFTPKYSLVLEMKPLGDYSPPSIEDNVVPERYPGEAADYSRLLDRLSNEQKAVREDL